MDINKEVTNRIIAEMEQGIIPWQKPWVASGSCISYATGKPYSLLAVSAWQGWRIRHLQADTASRRARP